MDSSADEILEKRIKDVILSKEVRQEFITISKDLVSELRTPSTKRMFDMRVSVVDILTIIGQIVTIVYVLTVMAKDIEAGQHDRNRIWLELKERSSRFEKIEGNAGHTREDMASIKTSIKNIETNIERLMIKVDKQTFNRNYGMLDR